MISNPNLSIADLSNEMKVSDHRSVDDMLDDLGIKKDHPFEAFFFLVYFVFGQQKRVDQNKDIDKLSGQMKQLSALYHSYTDLKQDFFNASGRDPANEQNWSADAVAAAKDFPKKMSAFVNKMMEHYQTAIGQDGVPFWNDPQGRVSPTDLEKLHDVVENPPKPIDELFPTLGGSTLKKVVDSIDKLKNFFIAYDHPPEVNLLNFWQRSRIGEQLPYGHNFPNPQGLQDKINTVSVLGTTLSGVSGVETAQLQFKQNNANELLSFVKNMLSDWSNMKKSHVQSMSQAGS